MISSDSSDLQRFGWARYEMPQIVGEGGAELGARSLEQIGTFFACLPPDRYEPGSNRYRRHGRAVFLPWTGELRWLPDIDDAEHGPLVDYDMQGYNTEFAGVPRQFPAIPPEIRADPLLERIMRFDLAQTLWLEGGSTTPLNVGVGCILLSAPGSGEEAVATPNSLHQDGGERSFEFVHLVVRSNVVGGVNAIASPRCVGFLPREVSAELIFSEFTLQQPLDTFAVHHSRVSHYVSPVRRSDPHPGARGVILVGISPLVKQL